MYGEFKIGFNQRKKDEESSDVKKVKVGFKKRGKNLKKKKVNELKRLKKNIFKSINTLPSGRYKN